MATPGLGYRLACDVLCEVSYHLVEPVLDAQITAISLDTLFQLSDPTAILKVYPGAQIVVGWGLPTAEIVTIIAVTAPNFITVSSMTNSHAAGETVLSPTFATQQPTDPLYTQQEMLGYLARAQNNFLNKVPLILTLSEQLLSVGQQYQATPPTTIEIERVAVTNGQAQTAQILAVTRTANVVTCTLTIPGPAPQFTPGLAIQVAGVTDDSFNTQDNATVTILTVSADGLTLTWAQTAPDSASLGGAIGTPLRARLYESSQEQLTMRDPAWQSNPNSDAPTNWYEDRTGVYQWGVGPIPRGSYYAEVLSSQRDSESLTLLSGFLLPDIFLPYVKYGVLAAAWSKDGEQRSPTLARFCQQRFDFGVMLAERFLRNVVTKTGQSVFAAASGGGR